MRTKFIWQVVTNRSKQWSSQFLSSCVVLNAYFGVVQCDDTKTSEAKGRDVVDKTLQLIHNSNIFPNDKVIN